MLNPNTAELQLLREKSLAGTLTLEDTRRALELIRKDRAAAVHAKGKTKKKKPVVDTNSLLDELEEL